MKFLPQELLKPLQEKFSEFQGHVKSAASDPPETPYKSKYAAFEVLEEMNSLVDRLETEDPELQLNIDIIECHIVLNCGVIKSEVEEPSLAEKLLLTALSLSVRSLMTAGSQFTAESPPTTSWGSSGSTGTSWRRRDRTWRRPSLSSTTSCLPRPTTTSGSLRTFSTQRGETELQRVSLEVKTMILNVVCGVQVSDEDL